MTLDDGACPSRYCLRTVYVIEWFFFSIWLINTPMTCILSLYLSTDLRRFIWPCSSLDLCESNVVCVPSLSMTTTKIHPQRCRGRKAATRQQILISSSSGICSTPDRMEARSVWIWMYRLPGTRESPEKMSPRRLWTMVIGRLQIIWITVANNADQFLRFQVSIICTLT